MGDLNKMRDSHLKRNHNLKQIVDIPTRGTATLDNIYTNLTDLYHRPVVIAPIGLSDHMVVIRTPSTSTKYTEPVVSKTSSRSCSPDDRARFAAALNLISWKTLFHLPSCEQQLQFFNSTITTLLDTHLPELKIRRCSSDRPWNQPLNSVKEFVGVKVNCDNLQSLANIHCSGNFSILANKVTSLSLLPKTSHHSYPLMSSYLREPTCRSQMPTPSTSMK